MAEPSVEELRRRARERGLPTSGSRAELQARLAGAEPAHPAGRPPAGWRLAAGTTVRFDDPNGGTSFGLVVSTQPLRIAWLTRVVELAYPANPDLQVLD